VDEEKLFPAGNLFSVKTKNPVPRLASALLSLFTPFENRASILGDYEEMFDDLARFLGPFSRHDGSLSSQMSGADRPLPGAVSSF